MNDISDKITVQRKAAPEASEPKEQPTAPQSGGNKKKSGSKLWIVGLVVGIIVVAAAAYVFDIFPSSTDEDMSAATVQADPDAVVALVNGDEVHRAELDEKMSELSAAFPQGAVDAGFELQVLDEIINLRLLVAEAEAQSITVTDEEVDSELGGLVEAIGGEEVMSAELARTGITMDDLRENMRQELGIRKLLDANTDLEGITVTDEEVLAAYEEAVAMAPEGQELPPLAEVGELARAQIIQSKSAEIVGAYLDGLRAGAEIEITL